MNNHARLRRPGRTVGAIVVLALALGSCAPSRDLTTPARLEAAQKDAPGWYRRHYVKSEHMVEMRDGVKLFTSVYRPRDDSRDYPVILRRTPYSCAPYGEDAYPRFIPRNTKPYLEAGYILITQDVRGAYMSEGEFVDMRPHKAVKSSPTDIDESTDTWDTIDWIVNNVPNNNGRVGMTGISYPGFYAAAGMIDAHPALKAVSPQAPIADWRYDDFFHHGAFFLPHNFNFFASFGRPRPEPTTNRGGRRFDHGTPDGYQFFLDVGPVSRLDSEHLKGDVKFWTEVLQHPNDDAFWRAMDITPHLRNVAPAVLTVGGWFDAEDLYGPLAIYRHTEEHNPGVFNAMVMGPWAHGGWHRGDGDRLGNVSFGGKNSHWFQDEVEFPFFQHHLNGGPAPDIREATVFNTGANVWRFFDQWPPADRRPAALHFGPGGALTWDPPASSGSDSFVSDPAKPVPYTETITTGMTREYMTDDQRFAGRRTDVLVFQTPPLDEDLTIAGPVLADLWVSTTGRDADWIVKLIDVFPPDFPDNDFKKDGMRMGGYQMMVRSEVIRGRFRNDYANPEPFEPGVPARVDLPLQDVLHTFKKGHRVMVQVQSTWFPLVDRNPQTWVDNIFFAQPEDFQKQTHTVHHAPGMASRIEFGVVTLPTPAEEKAAKKEE
ncbi:MAG: CocE/NonD family hydrolase [Phycisphaerales bacterium]|nr:CocE/NonD family hydrolase [Phycisphaerales bacterium]